MPFPFRTTKDNGLSITWCSKRIPDICGMYSSVNAFCKAMVDVDMTAGAFLFE